MSEVEKTAVGGEGGIPPVTEGDIPPLGKGGENPLSLASLDSSPRGRACQPLPLGEVARRSRDGEGSLPLTREVAREQSERDGGRDGVCAEQDYPSVTFGDTSPDKGRREGLPPTSTQEGALSDEESPEDALVERLSEEYLALCAELPDVPSFDALPPSVLEAAADGRTLAEAYFRYAYREKCRVEEERERQRAARAASTGSLAGVAAESVSPTESAMLRGIWEGR